jgi:hypothetical protein
MRAKNAGVPLVCRRHSPLVLRPLLPARPRITPVHVHRPLLHRTAARRQSAPIHVRTIRSYTQALSVLELGVDDGVLITLSPYLPLTTTLPKSIHGHNTHQTAMYRCRFSPNLAPVPISAPTADGCLNGCNRGPVGTNSLIPVSPSYRHRSPETPPLVRFKCPGSKMCEPGIDQPATAYNNRNSTLSNISAQISASYAVRRSVANPSRIFSYLTQS